VGDYVVLGSAPTRAALLGDARHALYFRRSRGTITPLDMVTRRLSPLSSVPVGQSPGALCFDPGEKPRLFSLSAKHPAISVLCASSSDRTPALLTMIPVGDRPREIAVKLF